MQHSCQNTQTQKTSRLTVENEDKIKLILDENRKKIAASGGAKKSRFSQYLQTQMKTMEETQKNAKNTPKKKK